MTRNLPEHPASYRDPAGFVFIRDGRVYRQVAPAYADDYRLLMDSGLYEKLVAEQLLIPHEEVEAGTLLPLQLPVISYPCEWSPDQLKDAALLTLKIMRIAIDHGMILKDASPRNIQWLNARPLFIDTLSFERYDPAHPWIAYRQFCESFLFPLYLHHYFRQGIHRTLAAYPEGMPAGALLPLLPLKSRLRAGVWLHVVLPAIVVNSGKAGRVGKARPAGQISFDKRKLLLLIGNLEDSLRGLRTEASHAIGWSRYYSETIMSQAYVQEKEKLFREMIAAIDFGSALDLGANDGYFSQILAEKKARVIAVDDQWACTNTLYRAAATAASEGIASPTSEGNSSRASGGHIYPLCVDIAEPTPASGFANTERSSFTERAQCDLVVALAVVHHLVLTKNIPFGLLADYLAILTRQWLIIEFVPVSDEKASALIRDKPVFHKPYDPDAFEAQFALLFSIEQKQLIPGTERILYLMRKKADAI